MAAKLLACSEILVLVLPLKLRIQASAAIQQRSAGTARTSGIMNTALLVLWLVSCLISCLAVVTMHVLRVYLHPVLHCVLPVWRHTWPPQDATVGALFDCTHVWCWPYPVIAGTGVSCSVDYTAAGCWWATLSFSRRSLWRRLCCSIVAPVQISMR